MAALAAGAVFVVNPMIHRQPIAGPAAVVTSASAQPAESPSPTGMPSPAQAVAPVPAAIPPAAAPIPPVANLAAFVCGSSTLTSGQAPPVAAINAVRTGSHSGYDRLTVQFSGAQPGSVELRPQDGEGFTASPRGNSVTLAGSSGILVLVRGADVHSAYSGLRDIKTGYRSMAEVRVLEDFEGQVQLGLGLNGAACYRASVMSNPTRLVIDVQAS